MQNTHIEITIRAMTEADLDEVLAIENESYPLPWNRDHFLDELRSVHAFPLVALDPGKRIIGYICPRLLQGEGQIFNVAVRRDLRGHGVARLLVERALDDCRKEGGTVVFLEVRHSNKAAIYLYRKLGFVETGIRRKYYENNDDAILMEYDFKKMRSMMQFKATILSNVELSPGYFRMRMTAPADAALCIPGQFLMVKVRDAIDPLLRRPFGIFDVGVFVSEYSEAGPGTFLEILYKVVGKGTGVLANLHHGDHLDILGPLGKGFVTDVADGEKILVGGGVGLAPLYYLARELVKNSRVHLFAGGRTREDILCITEFERLGVETYTATDDGSLGEQGMVTEVMEQYLANSTSAKTIFACGPFPMLKTVAEIAERSAIPCQVSLEAYMACGVGACLGCVVKGKNHTEETPDYRCVCKEGPVFDALELLWD